MLDLVNVEYDMRIPNNVSLSKDKCVQKALEKWHPGYINWWNDMIPGEFQESLVYLRIAVSVDSKGWAKFDYVKMPEYRWAFCWYRKSKAALSPVANIWANRPCRKCPANTASCYSG